MDPNRTVRGTGSVALALLGVLLSPLGHAAVVWPGPELPVGTATEQIGLHSRYFAYAFGSGGDTDTQADALNKVALNWTEYISHAGSVTAISTSNPNLSSFAEFEALAKVGELKGFTHVSVEGGTRSNTFVFMQFMDVLKVDKSGKLNFDWVVSGTADKQTHPANLNSFAASKATGELFVWPYGTAPTPGVAFPFTYYTRTIVEPTGTTHLVNPSVTYPAGSRWWVLGQIRLESTGAADGIVSVIPPYELESSARFEHTARLFINPDPSTPDVTFSALSGYDYRTLAVPEASTWLLLLSGLALLVFGVRSRASNPTAEGCTQNRYASPT